MDKAASSSANSVSAQVPVCQVHVGLQTILKIAQHAREMLPLSVTGQLLGMENGNILEVTDMFPFASAVQDETEQEEYQLEMMKSLRDVNIDHNTIGWYQSVSLEGFISNAMIEAQLQYQSTIVNSIVLIYDHARASRGQLAIKALRLKPEFIAAYRDKKPKNYSSFVGINMFHELEVKVVLSNIDQLLIATLMASNELPEISTVTIPEYESLACDRAAENLIAGVDEVLAESSRLQHCLRGVIKHHQFATSQRMRRKHENAQRAQTGEEPLPEEDFVATYRPAVEPSRIPWLMASSQLHTIITDVIDSAPVNPLEV